MPFRCLGVAALLALSVRASSAQLSSHEYRPQLQLVSPYWRGVALMVLAERRLDTSDLERVEDTQGVGLTTRTLAHTSAVLDLRQVRQANGAIEHRWTPALTVVVPVGLGFELRERARVELRDIAGAWSKRWQNRASLEHPVRLAARPLVPYLYYDLSYDTRFAALNRQQTALGMRIPIAGGTSMDPYVLRQMDDRRLPEELLVAGVILRVAM